MLNDKQSLILCGVMAVGIFATGILDILDNFIVKTILTIIFLAIVLNLIFSSKMKEKDENDSN